jgi:SAM-dependent methyltransferase
MTRSILSGNKTVQPDDIDAIYRAVPPDRIPWNIETPPEALVRLVTGGTVKPCRAIDLGCGAGNYAIYLASLGFEVIGVDKSPAAVRMASDNAKKRGVTCRFVVADLLGDLDEIQETHDFAFDWELLHHIFPEDREKYMKNVCRVLRPGALYFSVCFSEEDPGFASPGKYRKTPLGTTLYFSSLPEIRELLSPFFTIRSLRTVEISGKFGPHIAVCCLSVRR